MGFDANISQWTPHLLVIQHTVEPPFHEEESIPLSTSIIHFTHCLSPVRLQGRSFLLELWLKSEKSSSLGLTASNKTRVEVSSNCKRDTA